MPDVPSLSSRPYIDTLGIIFSIHLRVPVFHGFNWDSIGTDAERTRCGLALGEGWQAPTTLPIFHAENIADPCARCFPERWANR